MLQVRLSGKLTPRRTGMMSSPSGTKAAARAFPPQSTLPNFDQEKI